jgi:16S rRNA G966 N2-methylase RsmD
MMRSIKDYIRAFEHLFNYLFLEKPRGLDFSMRDLSEIKDEQQHGYAMTSDKAVKHLANLVDFKDKSFLDIGSGKGRVPYQAFKLGAKTAEGVEFSQKLHKIALNNYEILRVSNVCKSNCVDATQFDRYSQFNIFFLFNPFEDDLYEAVIDRLMEQCMSDDIQRTIICYGGANLKAVAKYDYVSLLFEGICPHRGNRIVIYTFN